MAAILPSGLFLIQESQVKLVDERRTLQDIGVALPSHIGRCHLPQMRVDELHQLLKCSRLSISPLSQKQSDISLGWLQSPPFRAVCLCHVLLPTA